MIIDGENKNPLLYLFGKNWEYSIGNRRKVVLYWAMFVVANIIAIIGQPVIFANMINIVQKEGVTAGNFKTLLILLFLTLVLELVFWSLHGPARCIERDNAFKVRSNYKSFLLRGVMGLPMEWHVNNHSGDTIDKIEKGSNSLFLFSESSFVPIFGMVRLVASISMLIYFGGWYVAVIAIIMLSISIYITIRFDRIMIPQYKELSKLENQISESIFDSISNISTVIILRVEKYVFNAILHKIEKPHNLFNHNQKLNEIKWFVSNICCSVMTTMVLGVYFWQNIGTKQGVMIGTLFILIKYLEQVGQLFFRFTSDYSGMVKFKSRIMNAEELSCQFVGDNLVNHVLPKDWQHLEVKNLNFAYDINQGANLSNVSLSLKRGLRYAFVGRSGGGKTTVLKVMRGLYEGQLDKLYCDGVEIKGGFDDINGAITLVPQDPEIFSGTIMYNIVLGSEYTQEQVDLVTDMACFREVVDSLPRGFNSSINEKGVNLSGGQKQRLALARGLWACVDPNKSLILLDEPTSSLDAATEMEVYENIFSGFPDRTIISSIHRLHMLRMFDVIYVFKDGKIVSSGNLDELLGGCEEFQSLWAEYNKHN